MPRMHDFWLHSSTAAVHLRIFSRGYYVFRYYDNSLGRFRVRYGLHVGLRCLLAVTLTRLFSYH